MILFAFVLLILVLVYLISTNREVHFWPNPSISPAAMCEPNACVKSDGKCGAVELWAGATHDKQSHGYDITVTKPAPLEKHYSSSPVEAGMFVGAAWQCK
jgi:hypothetical protein